MPNARVHLNAYVHTNTQTRKHTNVQEDKDLEPGQQMVSCDPDCVTTERDPENDQFIILACDGVWDVMTNKDCCLFIAELMAEGCALDDICSRLLDYCLLAGR